MDLIKYMKYLRPKKGLRIYFTVPMIITLALFIACCVLVMVSGSGEDTEDMKLFFSIASAIITFIFTMADMLLFEIRSTTDICTTDAVERYALVMYTKDGISILKKALICDEIRRGAFSVLMMILYPLNFCGFEEKSISPWIIFVCSLFLAERIVLIITRQHGIGAWQFTVIYLLFVLFAGPAIGMLAISAETEIIILPAILAVILTVAVTVLLDMGEFRKMDRIRLM